MKEETAPTAAAVMKGPVAAGVAKPMEVVQKVTWGRVTKAKWNHNIGAAFMIAFGPMMVYANWVALQYFGGSVTVAIRAIISKGLVSSIIRYFPTPTLPATLGYTAWLLWQTILYVYLPGPTSYGQRTPGGNLLSYNTNGLMAWSITHLLFLTTSMLGILDPAIIAKHWNGLFFAANVYGVLLTIFCQVKSYLFPTYPEDRKISGSVVFDFWAGVELNPRIGNFDFKFFHNGRPGIVAWTLIDLSWAAYQQQKLGYVTNEMMVVIALQAFYVVDFFWNEDWYLRTIDISHDQFGFMLAWGDTTFLPAFYTLQAQFLARHPVHMTPLQSVAVLAVGLTGYAIFRAANYERDYVRSKNGKAMLWGRPAEFIPVTYRTDDGKVHNSILLTSGWWGTCRHINYLADLVLSGAMCATGGFTHFLPWSYFFFMCTLLYHRAGRDESRCRNKYGKQWDAYCEKVRYRIVPGIY